ncbi:threonyl-tRNA synthetase [Methanococcus vannielii SB]|jgi:threonyl-tRNA synthetase|uniref:Threonine--tRNA ligase n=1 Tax=Methanococcus vannielii (strain ATCC 35089 / DSM 1224 / JCM 13029 / OCM 148 / SB) TaxID=406327 RepID=SYT_METVS|nr:threonine--tRNA ligase [Methanococcus vannielii]A6US27.1 RecName: Full=Threonine--tRNA ligase; AltName: Full=Threonyl-tRNA synthetase; Short=ThrRS [Methanococcus vannielii SB]ABR55299.1 threonyl-tRNA synthetase [Methanococcus vannielii SB]
MKTLLIHSDYLEFTAKEKTKIAEDAEILNGKMDECLTVFIAVEKEDESDPVAVIKNAVFEIIKTAGNLNVKNIVVYPYAHLSSDLGSPETAKEILKGIEKELSSSFEVLRAPFGWYKSFKISCKGHPLSELSRKIGTERIEKEKKEKVVSKFYIINGENSELTEVNDELLSKLKDKGLLALLKHELDIKEEGKENGEPPHVKYIKEKEICDYEPSSDAGHFRWYPKGKLIRDLLSDYVYNLVVENGGMPVETPVMYDLQNNAIREHADKFGERQYRFRQGNKDLMLRFAACFGQFMMKKDMYLLPKHLPLKLYELSTYSFRYEQRGELVGLKRLRGFTMPDMHTVCIDMNQAMEAFENQFWMGLKTGDDFKTPYSIIFRFTNEFFEENKEWFFKMAKEYKLKYGKDAILEILPGRKHYWVGKVDMAVVDSFGRPIENPTVQIDVESAQRFGITVHDGDKTIHPIILHCSPTGSIERVLCGLLENAYIKTLEDKPPALPTWLTPIQARVIPVSERNEEFALEVVNKLRESGIRTDFDDREDSMGKKIRNAGTDWVNYVVVIGDNEMESKKLTVTLREESSIKQPKKESLTVGELIEKVTSEIKGSPNRPLPLPMKCSVQPIFR